MTPVVVVTAVPATATGPPNTGWNAPSTATYAAVVGTQQLQQHHPLVLLQDVRWHGTVIHGERVRTLLALLVNAPRDSVPSSRLVTEIWAAEPPTNPTKALQVVVSRARQATSQDTIVRTPDGYRLGLLADQVDVLAHSALVDTARTRFDADDIGTAHTAAHAATLIPVSDDRHTSGPLGTLRHRAAERHRQAHRILGLTHSARGEHTAALEPLRAAAEHAPDDEQLLAALLRSEAATDGTGAALQRYEQYRTRLADRTGADPGPELRRTHTELLAADHPVRHGLRFTTTELLGREDDLHEIRGILHTTRILSLVGPGGLGKTRLATTVGNNADQPVVHLVELVGITVDEDVVGELGAALGVRDSVTNRPSLTPQQRADLRSRIAGQLDHTPTLLILDNCEHVIDAVAELVAFLVANSRDLRVLTTSRTPLNVAGEHVYTPDQLDISHAAELFRRRAAAARPQVELPEPAVTEVVQRLDGLPLAIELAAAKVRVMSVADIAARLQNRFALLRGGNRSAPDRHQTLLAVIDWSWNLLTERDRTALRWLSIFHDGFSLSAAEAVLGTDPLDVLHQLTDHSLVTVRDTPGGARYGMLETVREFGRMHLVDAGEEPAALAAQRRWARNYARRAGTVLFDPNQLATMNLLRTEESNLADILRGALAEPEPETAMVLLASLAGLWTVADEHDRLLTLLAAVDDAVAGWMPPADLADETRMALSFVVNTQFMIGGQQHHARNLLRELGTNSTRQDVAAMATVTLAWDPGTPQQLADLTDHPNRLIARLALLGHAQALENDGDPAAAITHLEPSLSWPAIDIGPWLPAMVETQLAGMHGQLGRHHDAARHARNALPALERLDATNDMVSARSLLVAAALAEGRITDAEREIAEVDDIMTRHSGSADNVVMLTVAAELDIAHGQYAEALRRYRAAAHSVGELRMRGSHEPTGTEPWTLYVRSAALCAHARHGRDGDGADLFETLSQATTTVLRSAAHTTSGERGPDYPITGLALFALALWGLAQHALPIDGALRLAVLAARFEYNRMLPTLAWEHLATRAERIAPGLLAQLEEEDTAHHSPRGLSDAATTVTAVLAARAGHGTHRHG